jgi:hypothetical protein
LLERPSERRAGDGSKAGPAAGHWVLLVGCAALGPISSPRDHAVHPLDDLTPVEIQIATKAVRDSGRFLHRVDAVAEAPSAPGILLTSRTW